MVPGELDLIKMISDAGHMVQFVLLLLFIFSAASWTIIFIKSYQISKAVKESDFFIEIFWESRDFAVAYKEAEQFPKSPIARDSQGFAGTGIPGIRRDSGDTILNPLFFLKDNAPEFP